MDFDGRVVWLKRNYHEYTDTWYYSDTKRTNAIFIKEYSKYINNTIKDIKKRQESMLKIRQDILENSYLFQYNSSIWDDRKRLGHIVVHKRILNLVDKSYKEVIIP